jgi:hypothetical protein
MERQTQQYYRPEQEILLIHEVMMMMMMMMPLQNTWHSHLHLASNNKFQQIAGSSVPTLNYIIKVASSRHRWENNIKM